MLAMGLRADASVVPISHTVTIALHVIQMLPMVPDLPVQTLPVPAAYWHTSHGRAGHSRAGMLLLCGFAWCGLASGQDMGTVSHARGSSGSAEESAAIEPLLQPFRPITGGETKDSNDVNFMDVNLSVKIRLTPARFLPRARPFFAMETRFGFYWGTRSHSPVIGKTYNPELLLRILPPGEAVLAGPGNRFEYAQFFEAGYAHESNGQLVHTLSQYQQQLQETPGKDYAGNFIHRGWDYLDVVWKKSLPAGAYHLTLNLQGRYFLLNGLLQGPEDEYHGWENSSEGKPRKAVDGLGVGIDYPSEFAHFIDDRFDGIGRVNYSVRYLTGYQRPFEFSTLRAEIGAQFWSLPVALWVQHGYMSSLANYYHKVDSVGIELRFPSF